MLEKLLKAAIGVEEKEVRIGKVNPDYAKRLDENKKLHDAHHEQIEKRIKDFVDQVKAESQERCDELDRQHEAIWSDIYDDLGLTDDEREQEHNFNRITGVVTKVERKVDPRFEEMFGGPDRKDGGLH